MADQKKKILVALDGSKKSVKTVEYLCAFKPFLKNDLVLCNIINKVPESYYDLKKEPFSGSAVSHVRAWEFRCRAEMETFMEHSSNKLIAAGFDPSAIKILISERKKGIARDLLEEARTGDYCALLCRRRGHVKLMLPVIMGSVSTKLVEKASMLPLILAGRHEPTQKLCVAIDGSIAAQRAAQFTADTVANSDCRIMLCSVIRDFEMKGTSDHSPYVSEVNTRVETALRAAADAFERAGIPKSHITTRIIQGVKSRAEAIVRAAEDDNCDTVVFGRKGKSQVSEFDIGRIPLKIIHGAKQMTVWVIP